MSLIKLSKANFFYNLDKIKEKTKSAEKIALVLKDNAYGHGLCEMASLAKEYGLTRAVVRSNTEAKEIEKYFEYVLVLADIPEVASEKIRYTINDLNAINKFPKDALVELKVDTGMGRNGVSVDELDAAFELIKKRGLKLEAVFTHHACADETDGVYETQKKSFQELKDSMPSGLRFHSCNSAALFREEEFSEEMARVGIAAYGCLELPKELNAVDLKPVLSLHSDKISSRTLEVGQSVGYGATFKTEEKSVVSNYDFGYADGFLRVCSNSYVTPEGMKIAGRISMDNSSFVSNEERLLIFNDAREVAKYAKTISYEVLSSLKPHLKRAVV